MTLKLKGNAPRNSTTVQFLPWDEPTSEGDFTSVKAISEKLTTDLIGKVDDTFKNKLRATYLIGAKHTAPAYKKVTPAYPLGCKRCTKLFHSEADCPVDFSKKGRKLSDKKTNEPLAKH